MNTCRVPLRSILLCIASAGFVAGCGATSREKQLHRVAKDWSNTIRASQVIPVYPLTSDLQPGDLFLVTESVAEQHEAYEEDGFLALPFRLGRLAPSGYSAQYSNSYSALNKDTGIPMSIRERAEGDARAPFIEAPHAAFPTYSFSVDRRAGLSLAVPVSSVPVGLSLLGSDSAFGTVAISDARTYGVDARSIAGDVQAWWEAEGVAEFLSQMRRAEDQPIYLRVISRVYLAHEFDVALQSRRSRSAGADAGAPRSVELVGASADPAVREATATDVASNTAALNNMLDQASALKGPDGLPLPGASARVVAASARSIALKERFDEPLVFGYVGFDFQVNPDGTLGVLVPTFQVLERKAQPPDIVFIGAFTSGESAYKAAETELFEAIDAGEFDYAVARRTMLEAATRIDGAMRSALADALPETPADVDAPVQRQALIDAWGRSYFQSLRPLMSSNELLELRNELAAASLRAALEAARR